MVRLYTHSASVLLSMSFATTQSSDKKHCPQEPLAAARHQPLKCSQATMICTTTRLPSICLPDHSCQRMTRHEAICCSLLALHSSRAMSTTANSWTKHFRRHQRSSGEDKVKNLECGMAYVRPTDPCHIVRDGYFPRKARRCFVVRVDVRCVAC